MELVRFGVSHLLQFNLPTEEALEALPSDKADEFRRDLDTVAEAVAHGVSQGRVTAASTAWQQWESFCNELGFDPGLSHTNDPIPILQVFGLRWRDGRLAPSGKPVRARTAEDAARHVGQAFSMLGADDPRLNSNGKLDYRLTRTFKFWKREDGPSQRRRPVPKAVLLKLTTVTLSRKTQQQLATTDLMWIGFFFLLRPSEYLDTTTKNAFKLCDVIIRVGATEYRGHTIPLPLLELASSGGFEFDEQKNGISGDIILLGTTTDPFVGPLKCIIRRVLHLRQHHAPSDTPLFMFWDAQGTQRRVTDRLLNSFLRMGASLCSIDARCTAGALRCTGATALLNSRQPPDIIKLLGRWRSDEVFRYLHLQSSPLTEDLAETMLQNF